MHVSYKILDCIDRSIWQMSNHSMLIYFCYLLNINMHDLHKHVSFISHNTKILYIIWDRFRISLYLRTSMIMLYINILISISFYY